MNTTKSRKDSGERLQRGIERGSSVKTTTTTKKVMTMCLGAKQRTKPNQTKPKE